MRNATEMLRDQRGNMTVFVLTIFFFFSLVMFTLLFNMSTIFVDKEVAANSAQQASLGATQIVYEEMERAIKAYDDSISLLIDPVFIWPLVEIAESNYRRAYPSWSESEVRYHAIDQVLSAYIVGNLELRAYVWRHLAIAEREIPGTVGSILSSNGAVKSGSRVKMFNSEQRIEVRTSVRYESETFGLDFLSNHHNEIEQTAEGRRIRFVEVLRWGDVHLSL
ncbi:Tad domain-containing protein [Brevibacillus sp. AY1]|uniref:Tad domain-containing protein n=1 Tax=Brevibacillus sp. AY1 TaxID=2807621 RepID=UPI002456594D|nr:Tad domain-containing protein [Brevibacillus sp. AY1]MDH4617359.1 Tad domain-containing protein [Brevibacillus sp. AY1]